jgi:hypothetical protein
MSTGAALEAEFWGLFSAGQIGSPLFDTGKRFAIDHQANGVARNQGQSMVTARKKPNLTLTSLGPDICHGRMQEKVVNLKPRFFSIGVS